ncbi:type VI secretion system tube protein Hcp [Vineibacter terrae]|uniref:Type VI secretion system tube protein Hcp n=1 Tax=Vineibacter terrae TaxID=2586908 RepID=A0A5C8PWL0_9HYPH|nr:type VI secretion system tube protein Hcp [Vineibacter terrae]TXL82343.1 type VI secretion system tube protein Hcp [Vineibacter terrae]
MTSFSGEIYVKVDDVKGSVVKPAAYVGWIAASSITWPGGDSLRGGRISGKFFPDFTDGTVYLTCTSGLHTPSLLHSAAQGRHIKSIQIHLIHPKITIRALIEDVLVAVRLKSDRTEEVEFAAAKGTASR